MPELRHACTSCGGSCSGVRVRVLDVERANAIEAYAEAFAIEQPFDNGALRQTEEGRCVFLNAQNLCRIHARYGADAKPLICRQYPIVGVRTESGARRGIDPGCYSAFSTQSAEVLIPNEPFAWSQSQYPEPLERMEQALIAMLSASGQTLEGVVARLAGQPEATWPDGLLQRLKQRVSHADFIAAATHPSAGPAVRAGLLPIVSELQKNQPWQTELTMNSDFEMWALEATKRVIWLRLCPNMPSPMIACLMSILGAVVVASTVSQKDMQVSGFTAWNRAMRSPMFWGHFFPDLNAVQWVLRG